MSAGGAGFRPSHVRWSVFRRRRGTSPSPTLGRRRCRRRRGMSAGGAGFRASHVRWLVFRRRRGTSPSPTLGRRRCRRRRGMGAGHTGGGVAAGRLGMSAGGAGFRPSHVRWSVFRRRRGTSPSPTLGRWRCRRRRGTSAGPTLGRWRCRRRCRVPALHFRWSVFRRRRGTSPSPTGGGVAAGRLGMSAGGAGFPPSYVRWSVFRRRRGTSPSPTLGRRRCRRRRGTSAGGTGGGVAAGRLGMSAGGTGFRPSHVRWSVFRRRRGTSPSPTGGGVAAGGTYRTVVIVSLAVGDECRRCRVPALPGTVVGVSPAAGDKPQPYI